MKLSRLTQTEQGESRMERWRPMPLTPDPGEDVPKLLFQPIPSPLQLFDDWKACLNSDMVNLLLDRMTAQDQGMWDLFKEHLTDPTLVDLERLARRLATKYVKDWAGLTDDQNAPIPFTQDLFLRDVFPAMAEWVIEEVSTLSVNTTLAAQAEKKIY